MTARSRAWAWLVTQALAISACAEHVIAGQAVADAGEPLEVGVEELVPGTCGATVCADIDRTIQGAEIHFPGCCYDFLASKCGFIGLPSSCTELGQEGQLSSECPPLRLFDTPLTLPGCCRPNGTCGGFESDLGLGCVQLPSPDAGGSCTYPPP